jgi:pyridoxine 4-dehydrogenase
MVAVVLAESDGPSRRSTLAEMQSETFTFSNGVTVNRLGFGAMRLTGIDEQHDIALLRRAVELGVNHVDTARMYGSGRNEQLVAKALVPFLDRVLIATKGGVELDGDSYRNDARPETLRQHVDESLCRLGVEQLALYYLHEPDPAVPIEECIGELETLRSNGKIALLGVSNVTLDQLRKALTAAPIAAVQNRYSAASGGNDDVLDFTTSHGIAFVPWGPIRGTDSADQALRALLDRAPNVLPIPGTTSTTHLEENVTAAARR